MERFSFMETQRIIFSYWNSDDLPLARLLWGDPQVTRYICVLPFGGKATPSKPLRRSSAMPLTL